MRWSGSSARSLVLLGAIALVVHVAAAFLLPNPEQDAYSYVEIITDLSQRIAAGNLHPRDLYGFWLPLYPLMAALPNSLVHQPLLVGKIISALFGAATCLLVFAATLRLTNSRTLALVAFAVVLIRPLYLLYSAASMTDAPNVCFVSATILAMLHRRWSLAAVLAALAEATRLESWTLLAVLPLLQFVCDRRMSFSSIVILLLPPLLWLAISHAATGDWLGYFTKRAQYQEAYLDFFSSRRHFVAEDVWRDVRYFIAGANPIAFFAVLAGGGCSAWQVFRRRAHGACEPLIVSVAACALIGFYVVAYATKRQPVILPRYAFAVFTTGVPLLAWFIQRLPYAGLVLLVTLWPFAGEIGTVNQVLGDDRAQRQIAAAVRTGLEQHDGHCFSDNPAVRVLSQLPPERFLRTEMVPKQFAIDAFAFAAYLRQERAEYVVYYAIENSLAVKYFPQEQADLVATAASPFGPTVALYRLHRRQ